MDGVRRTDAADSDELHDTEKRERDSGDGQVVDPREFLEEFNKLLSSLGYPVRDILMGVGPNTSRHADLAALSEIRCILASFPADRDTIMLVLANDMGRKLVPLEEHDFGF